jgi:prophage tail gpP-like protein
MSDTIELPPVTVEAPPQGGTPGTPSAPASNPGASIGQDSPTPPQMLGLAGSNREIATIEVNGKYFTNWTSMRIENRVTDTHPIFMFELTEQSPIPVAWYLTDMAPGAQVKVWLGGYLAITGIITERHVAFDANSHAVRIVGAGRTYDTVNSTAPLSQIGGHDNQNLQQIADSLIAHLGLSTKLIGDVDLTPFENAHVLPGETIITTVERYAKQRRVIIGSDEKGNMLLIGPHAAVASDVVEHLVEGINMLRANAVVIDDSRYRDMFATAQQHGNDEHNGDAANKQVAHASGSSSRNRQMVFPTEISDIPHGVEQRVQMEKVFTEGSVLEAHITVQGWFRKDGNPWRAGEYYWTESPSLILDRLLGARGAIYEQSDAGTTTTLEMVLPINMNGSEGAMFETGPGSAEATALAAGTAPL